MNAASGIVSQAPKQKMIILVLRTYQNKLQLVAEIIAKQWFELLLAICCWVDAVFFVYITCKLVEAAAIE